MQDIDYQYSYTILVSRFQNAEKENLKKSEKIGKNQKSDFYRFSRFVKKTMAKVIPIKNNIRVKELSREKCEKILRGGGNNYGDDDINKMKEFLEKLARIYFDFYQRTNKKNLKIVHLNKEADDTEKSNYLCSGKYRRAS